MKNFGETAFYFLKNLKPDFTVPGKVQLLLPFENDESIKVSSAFYKKYFDDKNKRTFILGINPGRHGAGVTGIAFTDPVRLENDCEIKNFFPKKGELSSEFIYYMINKWGGAHEFYSNFFLTAVCPVGFMKDRKNINYYDDKNLIQSSREFIIASLKRQLSFGAHRNVAICLGEGKNYNYLKLLNDEFKFFKEIVPLAHPRFIMQYKRKQVESYCTNYLKILTKAIEKNET